MYEGIRKITGKDSARISVVKDRDGRVITEGEKVRERWKEYFQQLYNDPNPVDRTILQELDSGGNSDDAPGIMLEEVARATRKLKTRKSPGLDNISTEEIQAATEGMGIQFLHRLCKQIWEDEIFPLDWKRAIIVPIHKKKDKLDCNNYRGISLLCHCSKIFTSILMDRLRSRTEEILSEEQAGFRASRSTIDQIFTLRQLAEKYTEFSKSLYICYVDFKKAFDSIWREGLWKVMRHLGYPYKLIRLLESLYEGTFSAVRTGGDFSEWFETIVGVLQGCMLSPLLFNIFLEIIMARAVIDVDAGAVLSGTKINNLRFADDIAAMAEDEDDLQEMVDHIARESSRMGLKINVDKTEVQHVGRGNRAVNVNIKIDDRPLKQVENFVYLGGNMSEDASVEHDVRRRIGLATGVMQSLNKIWQNKRIGQATKVKIYETLVLSVLLYNSETWTMKEATKNSVLVFEMGCLRKILGVSRRNHIRNLDIRAALNVEVDVVRKIQRRRLKYFGHVTRMEGSRFPNLALYGRVHGHRERGRPRKRWLDNIREDCLEINLDVVGATRLAASDREKWRSQVVKLPEHATALPRP